MRFQINTDQKPAVQRHGRNPAIVDGDFPERRLKQAAPLFKRLLPESGESAGDPNNQLGGIERIGKWPGLKAIKRPEFSFDAFRFPFEVGCGKGSFYGEPH